MSGSSSRFSGPAPGLVADLHELIGAESLSQRYHFATILAHRLPALETLVHDVACHLLFMCREHENSSPIGKRLGQFNFIIDRFHAPGHVGEFCRQHCLADLPPNKAILSTFPTDIAESVNSQFSPLGHVVHHMNKWFSSGRSVSSMNHEVFLFWLFRRSRGRKRCCR